MIKRINTVSLAITAMTLIVLGCNPSSRPHSNDTVVIEDTLDYQNSDTSYVKSEQGPESILMIPSPAEILPEILGANIKYDKTILNPVKNHTRYLDLKSQAFNLGVYVSDLSYINLNKDKTEAIQYFQTIRELAQKLNIYQPFQADIYTRLQNNISSQDSLNSIFTEIFYKMLDVLETSNQHDVYALVITGAIIESLYIPVMSIENSSNFELISTKIVEQKYFINNFFEYVSKYKEDKNIREVLSLLSDIKIILNTVDSKPGKKVVFQKDNGNFTISGGEDIMVTKPVFLRISKRVKEIRSEIVNSN